MAGPLLPKATAVWLIENTTLTFEQIAAFCGFHVLEVEALANDDTAQSVKGVNPIETNQITADDLDACMKDPARRLTLNFEVPLGQKRTKGPRYTPLSKRQDKPDAVAWILRNYGELTDNQIVKLIGTTKATIDKIRSRTHWNIQSIRPRSPIDLGLCTQEELDRTSSSKRPTTT